MKSRLKNSERVTVFAASKGLSVEAMTETVESMTSIMSRFHRGQFYRPVSLGLSKNVSPCNSHQWIVWVITRLWYE